jgi:hypothetical protein
VSRGCAAILWPAVISFTDLAALTIANTMQSHERGELAEQLQRSLDARVVIEQARACWSPAKA